VFDEKPVKGSGLPGTSIYQLTTNQIQSSFFRIQEVMMPIFAKILKSTQSVK